MTNGMMKKIEEELLTNQDLVGFAKAILKNWRFDPVKDFPQTTDSKVISTPARKMLFVNKTARLLRRAIVLGATEGELRNISMHLLVLEEAFQHKLDYRTSESINNIEYLSRKYSQQEYMDFAVGPEETERYIRNTKRYYMGGPEKKEAAV